MRVGSNPQTETWEKSNYLQKSRTGGMGPNGRGPQSMDEATDGLHRRDKTEIREDALVPASLVCPSYRPPMSHPRKYQANEWLSFRGDAPHESPIRRLAQWPFDIGHRTQRKKLDALTRRSAEDDMRISIGVPCVASGT